MLPGSATDSSASATNGARASASENTATVAMSRARAERITREAISPRLAMSSFLMRVICVMPPAYIRKTPKPRRPSITWEWAADRPMASTVRVSRGSMTPSS